MPYEVHDYSIDTLRHLLRDHSGATDPVIERKLHVDYFEDYFSEIGAKTIVVELGYIDRDYLNDYTHHYATCFAEYERTCARLHFFSASFSKRQLSILLGGRSKRLARELPNSYLGFVVVKPLPETIVGRTCLRTYNSNQGRRVYPITRKYSANLFGLELAVDSLAFQEQDRAVAVCATSALWTVFQGTGALFHHPFLSPFEITVTATERSTPETRTLLRGLNTDQLAKAVRSVGLEPYVVATPDEYTLRAQIYAHLTCGIPMILGFSLYDTTTSPNRLMGKHAVAVTGYSSGHPVPTEFGSTGFLNRCTRIDRIYVHDDQVGPFARMKFFGDPIVTPEQNSLPSLSTSWRGGNGQGAVGSARALINDSVLLIPLYHKIRIPFQDIQGSVILFDSFLDMFLLNGQLPLPKRCEWDIRLSTINVLKAELLSSENLPADRKRTVLTNRMPRYMWRATARSANRVVLDLLFDATDLIQGSYFICAVEYDQALSDFLRALARQPNVQTAYHGRPESTVLDWFANQPL